MPQMSNPDELIDEFKKSGEFDRLRRELLTQFQHSERSASLQSRVEEIARQRLGSDPELIHQAQDAIYRELMGEIDRYPILERAVAEAPLLNETSFSETIRRSVERILDAASENHSEQRQMVEIVSRTCSIDPTTFTAKDGQQQKE